MCKRGDILGRLVYSDRRVRVELCNPRDGDLVAALPYVARAKEELRGEICDSHRGGIVECEALDAGQGDVLGDLDTQTLEADDKDVGCAHALHGLVAQDIELSAVERLVDIIVAYDGVVDRHPRDEVDVGEPLCLWTSRDFIQ